MKYRKKPVVVDAVQWHRAGDHPKVGECEYPGKKCGYCHEFLGRHGFIATLEGGHVVCPGDWIITGVAGESYPCKPDIFNKTYELIKYPDRIHDDIPNPPKRPAAPSPAPETGA